MRTSPQSRHIHWNQTMSQTLLTTLPSTFPRRHSRASAHSTLNGRCTNSYTVLRQASLCSKSSNLLQGAQENVRIWWLYSRSRNISPLGGIDILGSSLFWVDTQPMFNRLTPNDPYMGRTAPLTSKRCILYIYLTNIGTEYFKHALYSPFFLFKIQFVS